MSAEQAGYGRPLRAGDTGYYEVVKDHLRHGVITHAEMLSLLRLHGFLCAIRRHRPNSRKPSSRR